MANENAPALLFIATDIDPAHEAEVNRWYDERHLPQRQALPGFRSARRFVATNAGPKYLALYDLESPDALKTSEYRALSQPPVQTDEDRQMMQHFRNTMRAVLAQIRHAGAETAPPPEEATALNVVGLEPEPAYEEEYNAWYDTEHIPWISRQPGVLRARRFRAAEGVPRYLMLWELSSPEVRLTPGYQKAAETPWTFRMRAHCNRRISTIYRPLVPQPARA